MNMKRLLWTGLLGIVFAVAAAPSFASTSASASAGATIAAAIAIEKTVDLHFGVIIPSATADTVVVTPAGERSHPGSGVTLINATPAATAAAFTVTGQSSATYAIGLPADGTITITGAGSPMAVDTFTSTPTVATGGTLTGGTQTLMVGATLHVGISQTVGVYSGSFNVTVAYN